MSESDQPPIDGGPYLIVKPATGLAVQSPGFRLHSINLGKVFDNVLQVFKWGRPAVNHPPVLYQLRVYPAERMRWAHDWVEVKTEDWGN